MPLWRRKLAKKAIENSVEKGWLNNKLGSWIRDNTNKATWAGEGILSGIGLTGALGGAAIIAGSSDDELRAVYDGLVATGRYEGTFDEFLDEVEAQRAAAEEE